MQIQYHKEISQEQLKPFLSYKPQIRERNWGTSEELRNRAIIEISDLEYDLMGLDKELIGEIKDQFNQSSIPITHSDINSNNIWISKPETALLTLEATADEYMNREYEKRNRAFYFNPETNKFERMWNHQYEKTDSFTEPNETITNSIWCFWLGPEEYEISVFKEVPPRISAYGQILFEKLFEDAHPEYLVKSLQELGYNTTIIPTEIEVLNALKKSKTGSRFGRDSDDFKLPSTAILGAAALNISLGNQ